MTHTNSRLISIQACGVLLVGLVVRMIAWANTPVINPDGALFIHQARAIYYGQTDTLFCALNYLPNLPILIMGGYWLFHDWVLAARFVSLLFGVATLVPIYLLLKCYCKDRISVLGTLVFAVLPVFVGSSVDIIRDPISWFFSALGLYWFSLGLDSKGPWFLTWSSLSLLMATWARIETLLLVVFSVLFLLFRALLKKDQAFRQLAFFLAPLCVLASIGFIVALAAKGFTAFTVLLGNAITNTFSSPFTHYRNISEKLAAVAFQNRYEDFGLFLAEARKNMWLVAFGSVLNRCLEAFFFLYLIVGGMGFRIALKRFRIDQHMQYFICISIISLGMLYLHTIRSWYIEYRHTCLLIISSSVFIGFGIDRLFQAIKNRFSLKENLVFTVLAFVIVALPLYKDLKPRDADKRVFKEIGEFMANRESKDNYISITTSCSNYRLISFYANLDYRGAPCPVESKITCWEHFADNFNHFIEHSKAKNFRYFVWSEKLWPTGGGSVFEAPYNLHFRELKRWYHPDTGEMVLFELIG